MSTEILVAIYGLVSTIVGAIIGARTTYVLAVRREQADREKDSRGHAIEVKRAARLIDGELLRAKAAAEICVEKGHWWSEDVSPLSTDAWQKYGGTIAADLSDQAWLALIIAVEAIDNIRVARDMVVEAGLEDRHISPATADQVVPMLRDIVRGREALAPFVFDCLPTAGNLTKLPPG